MQAAKRADRNVADMPLSDFAIIHAARSDHNGMAVILDEPFWEQFRAMAPRALAKQQTTDRLGEKRRLAAFSQSCARAEEARAQTHSLQEQASCFHSTTARR
jgi:hypothetical protein